MNRNQVTDRQPSAADVGKVRTNMVITKEVEGVVDSNDGEFAEINTIGIEGIEDGLWLGTMQIRRVNMEISLSYMYPGKMQKIKAEYTRLYPMGRVETWRVRLQVAMFAFLALAAVFLGFFR
jgi:hypothetical protein